MKKRFTVILVILSMAMSLLVPSAMAFSDTKGHWAEQSITRWVYIQVTFSSPSFTWIRIWLRLWV